MSPGVLAFIATIRYALLFILGVLAQNLADQFAKGNYALDFATLQGYVMPAVIVILGYVWKLVRESNNPFVTTLGRSNPPAMRNPDVRATISPHDRPPTS